MRNVRFVLQYPQHLEYLVAHNKCCVLLVE